MSKLAKRTLWISGLRLTIAGMRGHFRNNTLKANMDAKQLDPRQYRRLLRAERKAVL